MKDVSIMSLDEFMILIESMFKRYEEKIICEGTLIFVLYSILEKINRNSNIIQKDYNKIIDLLLKNKFLTKDYIDNIIEELLLANVTQKFTHENFSKWNDYKRMDTINNIINS